MQTTILFHSEDVPVADLENIPGIDLRAMPVFDGRGRLSLPIDIEIPAGSLLVSSLSIVGGGDYAYRIVVGLGQGTESAQIPLAPIGRQKMWSEVKPQGELYGTAEGDCIRTVRPADRATLYIELDRTADLAKARVLLSFSILQGMDNHSSMSGPRGRILDLPPVSQKEQPEAIGNRICSPTCITMALRHFGIDADPVEVAAKAYHRDLDLYGVWPSAIYAASLYGVGGFLSGVAGLDDVPRFTERNMPLIASIGYPEGALRNAATSSTQGHLVAVCGVDASRVIVNDPAADSAGLVRRRYDVDEFTAAWANKRGLAYILLPPGG